MLSVFHLCLIVWAVRDIIKGIIIHRSMPKLISNISNKSGPLSDQNLKRFPGNLGYLGAPSHLTSHSPLHFSKVITASKEPEKIECLKWRNLCLVFNQIRNQNVPGTTQSEIQCIHS